MKVALISDIHANIFALESVYALLDKEKVEKILVSGDLIGYYYWPKKVVDLLIKDERVVCIGGNHESILEEVRNDSDAAIRYRKKYGSGYDVCLDELSDSEIDWLINLPKNLDIEINGTSFHLSHGTLDSVDEYLYPDADLEKLKQNYSSKNFTVLGHTHYPFLHCDNGKYLVNPGSVGQPRDVGGLASYAIVNLDNQALRFMRTSFDKNKVIDASKKYNPELTYLWDILSR